MTDELEQLKADNASMKSAHQVRLNRTARCDPEIYRHGTPVASLSGPDALVIEAFVQFVSKQSGVKIDWHYFGGRVVVLALGDVEKAKEYLDLFQLRMSLL